MKKFLLVSIVGIVLAMDIFGIAKEIIEHFEMKEEVVDRSFTIVYTE